MRTLVTGGAGFIGSHIAQAALDAGHEVTVLDDLDPRVHPDGAPVLPDGARFVRGDVLDADLLARLVSGVDVVFHEAAMVGLGRGALDVEDYLRVNGIGTARLLRAAASARATATARPPRVVLASSMAIYGEGAYHCPACDVPREAHRRASDLDAGRWEPACPACGSDLDHRPVREDHVPRPGTVYAVSKLGQEQLAMAVGRDLGVDVVALRYHNVYGARMPRDTPYAGVAALFKSRVLAGLPPLVHEDGRQLRDFVRVEDVACANVLAAEADADAVAGEAFQVGTGQARPIMDLARGLAHAIDPDVEPALSGTYRPGDARHVYADVRKARRVLGFEAAIGFEEGVRRFVDEPARAPPRGPA